MPRPYRTPGGIVTTVFALFVAALAVVATFLVDSTAGLCLAVSASFMLYFGLYSRHDLWWRAHRTRNSPHWRERKPNWNDHVPPAVGRNQLSVRRHRRSAGQGN